MYVLCPSWSLNALGVHWSISLRALPRRAESLLWFAEMTVLLCRLLRVFSWKWNWETQHDNLGRVGCLCWEGVGGARTGGVQELGTLVLPVWPLASWRLALLPCWSQLKTWLCKETCLCSINCGRPRACAGTSCHAFMATRNLKGRLVHSFW